MGTSKGYGMPAGGEWTPLKIEANKFVKNDGKTDRQGNPVPVSPADLMGRFLNALGSTGKGSGSGGGATGGGGSGGGKGGGFGGGPAARSTGSRVGGFLSGVSTVGFTRALEDVGLGHLVGKSAKEVARGLLDAFTDPGCTLDEHAVREALSELYKELFEGAKSFEDVEAALSKIIDSKGIDKIIASFFSKYLFWRFCTGFYEKWQKQVGVAQAGRKLESVRNFLASELEARYTGEDMKKVDWRGSEGERISDQIMQKTFHIYGIQQ
jgi:hypothetical protein